MLDKSQLRLQQIEDWKKENRLGFDLWTTQVTYQVSEIRNKTLQLTCMQCKDGVYILQVDLSDNNWLVYKCNQDLSLK